MADGLNRVTLLGNLVADAELRMSGGGMAILKLRLATNESFLDSNKTRQERVEYHRCTIFGKRAEGLSRILAKGSRVLVEGGLRTTSYEKDGQKRYTTEIAVNNVVLLGGGNGGGGQRRDSEPGPSGGDQYDDDSIPF